MPRKEYKTITVKNETFARFQKIKRKERMQNSPFIDKLLNESKAKKAKFGLSGRKLQKKTESL